MVHDFEKQDSIYKYYSDFLNEYINKLLDNMIVGRDISNTLGLFTTYHLLMQIRNECFSSIIVTQEDLECMSKILLCYDIKTTFIEDTYPQGCEDKQTVPPTIDGIGFMSIQGDGVDYPINRIRAN